MNEEKAASLMLVRGEMKGSNFSLLVFYEKVAVLEGAAGSPPIFYNIDYPVLVNYTEVA